MKVDKKWLGGLMFGAVLFAAAGNSGYAGYESGNMWESLSDVFSQYGIVSYAAEISSVDLSQVKKVEYGNLRELIKAGNFSYLQSEDSHITFMPFSCALCAYSYILSGVLCAEITVSS